MSGDSLRGKQAKALLNSINSQIRAKLLETKGVYMNAGTKGKILEDGVPFSTTRASA